MWNRVLRHHALPALLTGIFAACLVPSGAQAADANAVAQEVLSNPAFQSTFPGEQAADSGIPGTGSSSPSQDGAPPDEAPADDSTEQDSQPPQDMPSDPAAAGAGGTSGGMNLQYLPLVLAAAAFVILAIYLLTKLRRQPMNAAADNKAPAPRHIVARTVTSAATADAPPPPPGPLDDAEQLAAGGRYSEAIHLVLLRLLAELRHRVDLSMADSLTSREILRRNAALPAMTREALGVVIGAVELCHFGGRHGDATLFRHCVDAYMRATGRGTTTAGAA